MKGLLGSSSGRQYLRDALKRWTRRIFYPPRKFNIKPMKDLAPTVSADVFLSNDKPAYCELLGGGPVVRTSSLDIISHDNGAAFAKLSEKYADKSYASTAINALRLKNVYVDELCGVCITSDAMMVDEITAVARGIDPRLAHVAFLSMNDEAFTPDDYPVIDHPAL